MTMSKNDAAESRTVALYWDFENIHAGLCEEKEPGSYARGDFRFKPQEPLVNVQAVVDLAASFGPISIIRLGDCFLLGFKNCIQRLARASLARPKSGRLP